MTNASTFRVLRARLNWNQTQLAEKLGVSRAAIGRYENGSSIPEPVRRLFEQLCAQVEDKHPKPAPQPKVANEEAAA